MIPDAAVFVCVVVAVSAAIMLQKNSHYITVYSFVHLSTYMHQDAILLPSTILSNPTYSYAYLCTDTYPTAKQLTNTASTKPLYSSNYLCEIINSAAVLLPNLTVNKHVYYCALLCTDIFSVAIPTPKTTFNKHLYCYTYLCADMEDPFARMRCCLSQVRTPAGGRMLALSAPVQPPQALQSCQRPPPLQSPPWHSRYAR